MTSQKLDYEKATSLLANGKTVREVAEHFGATTQAVYWAIARGYVRRPQTASA